MTKPARDSTVRVCAALRAAHLDLLRRFPGVDPTPSEIVFQMLQDCADIARRMQVRGDGRRQSGAWWPDIVHNSQERIDALKQRMIDLAAGDSPEALFGFRLYASPIEIETMEAVYATLHPMLVGKQTARDWKILHLLASGQTSRETARMMKVSNSLVDDRKKVQVGVMALKLAEILTGLDGF